jgi:profilin
MSAIAASFNDKSETKAVIANGVKVNGDKYMTIESTDDSLKAKKVRNIRLHASEGRNTDAT